MKRTHGFSIVELIVVIVIIAILMTIAIVAYGWMRRDAEVASYVATIKQIEKGFNLKMTRERLASWPRDTDRMFPHPAVAGGASQANMLTAVKHQNFSSYMGDIPSAVAVGSNGGRWMSYDNDGDVATIARCDTATSVSWRGVLLTMGVRDKALLEEIDRQIDDGNIHCGRVRKSNNAGTGLMYILSEKEAL